MTDFRNKGWIMEKGRPLGVSYPYNSRAEALAFARSQGLTARCIRSRPAGYVVERPVEVEK